MTDILRELLGLREELYRIAELVDSYGYTESLPEMAQIQALERQIFAKVSEWEKPDLPWPCNCAMCHPTGIHAPGCKPEPSARHPDSSGATTEPTPPVKVNRTGTSGVGITEVA
jgi:hypothetical protein